LARGRLEEAAERLEQALSLNRGQRTQLAAEVALYRGILARVRNEDDTPALEEIRSLVAKGFQREPWGFDPVLRFFGERASAEDHALYSALAAGILDAGRVPDIDALVAARAAAAAKPAKTPRPARRNTPRRKRRP